MIWARFCLATDNKNRHPVVLFSKMLNNFLFTAFQNQKNYFSWASTFFKVSVFVTNCEQCVWHGKPDRTWKHRETQRLKPLILHSTLVLNGRWNFTFCRVEMCINCLPGIHSTGIKGDMNPWLNCLSSCRWRSSDPEEEFCGHNFPSSGHHVQQPSRQGQSSFPWEGRCHRSVSETHSDTLGHGCGGK